MVKTKDNLKISKLARFIQYGLLIIVAVMPFHAFLSVWLGSITHHQAIIQSWKEVLLLILSGAAVALVAREPERINRLRQPWIYAIGGFIAIAAVVTFIARPSLVAAVFGLKTDLEYLVAGVIACLVSNRFFIKNLSYIVLASAAIVCCFDVIQVFFLPPDFLTHFGYGPKTILPYEHIAKGTSALRFPATLGGPNQLGTYLLLPLTLSLLLLRRKRWLVALIIAGLISLFATYSRAAWLGGTIAIIYALFILLPNKLRKKFIWGAGLVAFVCIISFPLAVSSGGQLQYFLLHSSLASHGQSNLSDSQHASSLKTGYELTIKKPFGHGLGTAGPAVFHAGNGIIIEDYYLQLGYETGVLGLIVFGIIMIQLMRKLLPSKEPLGVACFAALTGVSVACFVLPAWTDSSTALIVWICAGACTINSNEQKNV